MEIFNIVMAGMFGAIFGSYATLFAHRLPIGQSCFGRYFGKKSACPACGYTIRTRELIPVLNWLFTLGKCRKCKGKIPKTHLFLELSSVSLYVLCYLKFGFTEQFIIYALISSASLILIVTDLKHRIFPFQVMIFLVFMTVIARVLQDGSIIELIYSGVAGVITSSIFYYSFYKKINGYIDNKGHSYDYVKFILIASTLFPIIEFLIYFSAIMIIFSLIAILSLDNKKKKIGYGFCLVIPFLWLNII